MTSTERGGDDAVASAVSPEESKGSGDGLAGFDAAGERRDRWVYRIVALLAVLPVAVSAIRSGLDGWIPTNDAAAAVLRAKYALGLPPSWTGLYAWPSSHAIDATTYTAGPWHLWWMSIPVNVLGVTWGPLLSMAALNTAFLVVAGWSVRRRLGSRSATFAMVFLGALVWSMGAAVFHSPVPVVAVVAPFAAFCFVAWALAAGDEGLLPLFAGLASYLILNFPETTLLVPMIGGCALVIWIVPLRRLRSGDPEGWRRARARSIRLVGVAVVVTVILWLPPLIEQFTSNPGNLSHLYRASGELSPWMSLRRSIAFASALLAGSPFWLRGSTEHSVLTGTAMVPSTVAVVSAVVGCAAAFIGAGFVSARRRDRPAASAVGLAGGVVAATWLHMVRAPRGEYFLPVWPMMMFTTFALAYAFARAVPARVQRLAPAGAVTLAVVLGIAILPSQPIPHFTATSAENRAISKSLNRAIIPVVRDRGTVTVAAAFDGTFPYAAALVVALDDEGIPVCDQAIVSFQGYDNTACDRPSPGVIVQYRSAATFTEAPPGETVVARHMTLTPAERQEWKDLSLKVWGGVDQLSRSGKKLVIAEKYRELVPEDRSAVSARSGVGDFAAEPGLINSEFAAQQMFARAVVITDVETDGRGVFARLPGVSDDELLRWAQLRGKLARGVVVTVQPHP